MKEEFMAVADFHERYCVSNGNSEKSEPQMGFEPMTLCDLVRCSVVSQGEMWVLTRTASQSQRVVRSHVTRLYCGLSNKIIAMAMK